MRAQMIHGIMKEGVWISNPSQIKEEFLNFFKEKFKDYDSNVDFHMFANSSRLCSLDHDSLETLVSLDDVKNAFGIVVVPRLQAWMALALNGVLGLELVYPHPAFVSRQCIGGLHNTLSIAVSLGLIRGVKFSSPEVTIPHLFYVDDVIITTEWNAND
ncbi:hypothetical protein Tco_0803759 [Tanacetum coccineum]|uniref:Uncharacterized protein n=1 Tax=Tanacetum coccineum TaxID=301880 RepID=A0ABQ5A503_9ASTR